MKRVGIIGAGPAGLTAGHELARRGLEVEIFEAGPHVGGMSRTIELWGHKVDLGPHRFFTRDDKVRRFWTEMAGEDRQVIDRRTRIYFGGLFYDYPLRPLNALANMGPWQAARCVMSYAGEKLRRKNEPESFEDWVVGAFGRRLYEMFFKSYSEKLWGITCDELDADFAAQRIKKFSLGEAALGMLRLKNGSHATLVDQFDYPAAGTGAVYDRMAESFRGLGGKLHLATPVSGMAEDGHSLRLENGETLRFDHLISTMPLTALCASLPDLPEKVRSACTGLAYRHTLLVYLLVDQEDLFSDQWLYIHSPELRLGRVTNFRNWSAGIRGAPGQSVLALEYWCSDGDALHGMSAEELQKLAVQEIRTTGLIKDAQVLDATVVRIPKCYPVYRKGYRRDLAVVMEHLKSRLTHVTAIGRYGAFKYNNQDHSILMGLLAAENLGDNARHDLWSINTDYGVYQESM